VVDRRRPFQGPNQGGDPFSDVAQVAIVQSDGSSRVGLLDPLHGPRPVCVVGPPRLRFVWVLTHMRTRSGDASVGLA
jgi:hypothetical protein